MEPRGRLHSKRKAFDSLEYLKFALSNCRKNRLKDEYAARAKYNYEETKIKAVNTKGSIFYYSVTNSNNSDDSDTESSDSEDDDEEDEITNHLSLHKPENFQDFISDFHSKDELISGLENNSTENSSRNQETNLDNLFHFEDMEINEMWINDFQNDDSATTTNHHNSSSQQQELLNFAENLMSDMTKDLPNSNELTTSASNAESIEEFTQNLGTLPDGDDLYKYAEICDSAAFFSSTVDEFISEFSAMTLNQ